jgi:hypothetical protein
MRTTTQTNFYGNSTSIESYCFSIAFFRPNNANANVAVNGIPIAAGQTLTINQNIGDMDTSRYEIVFTAGANPNELFVIKVLPVDPREQNA